MSAEIEARIGHVFARPELLAAALTAPSFAHENDGEDYQRLEFLGDSVLQIVVTEWLYHRYPKLGEGGLNDLRQQFVCEGALADHARALELGPHVRLGVGDRRSNRGDQASVLADVLEAVLGAVFVDAGIEAVKRLLVPWLEAHRFVTDSSRVVPNPKSTLQEFTQGRWKLTPAYRLTTADGPDHQPRYVVEVALGERVLAVGEGPNKKEATRNAALRALIALEAEG